MNKKAFTLIELLAVIVILTIIALIAVPIVLNIINSSKEANEKLSIEEYGKAIELAIYNYELDLGNTNELTLDKLEPYIEYKGNKVECSIAIINSDNTVYLDKCKVENKEVRYTYGTNKLTCILVSGTSKTVGAKYTCKLDIDRTFYVLENNALSDEITLLMGQNYADETVPVARIPWCIDGENNNKTCQNITSKEEGTYLSHIQEQFGNRVTVDLPSEEQMKNVGCTNQTGSCPEWAYDYLHETPNSVSGAYGYWTSTPYASNSIDAWAVSYHGHIFNANTSNIVNDGLRPVITLSKSTLN